jgi:hypothetical protein
MTFADIPGALAAISEFLFSAGTDMPEDAGAALVTAAAATSPVDRIVGFGRAVHNKRAELGGDAHAIGLAALAFAAQNGWHGLASEAPDMIADLIEGRA